MNRHLAVLLASLFFLVIYSGCAQHREAAKRKAAPRIPPTPPIYQDTSDFKKPPCSTPEIKIMQGSLCGNLIGTSDGKAVNAYLGIPFAETTGGQNRWKTPAPKAAWDGTLRATRLGPACPQNTTVMYPQSEDCLSVNVWTPGDVSPSPRAVMVFIYGGAFIYGYNADPLYDGAYTAAYGDVVVVSMNYRLGALGFLSGIKDRKTGEAINGNFGILDQVLALEWVRDNIGAFGGDPDKVTIYGESAGAMSVGLHLLSSPRSVPLFRAGIMESNPLGLPYKNLKQSRSIAGEFASNLGCPVDDTGCMRAKLPEVVLDAQMQRDLAIPFLLHGIRDMLVWSPVVDGEVITSEPVKALSDGGLKKPMILGTNGNEGLLFVEVAKSGLGWKRVSDFDYRLVIEFFFRDHKLRKKIYEKYPPQGNDNTALVSKVFSEYLFTCPNLYAASRGTPETWSYIFEHVPSFNVWPRVPACADAVCHAAELSFVFHTPEGRRGKFTAQENELSNLMVGYWTDFAKNINPDGAGNAWPEFTPGSLNLVFVTPVKDIQAKTDTTSDCVFWDSIGYNLRDSFWGLF
jgi:carboxylesterase type B